MMMRFPRAVTRAPRLDGTLAPPAIRRRDRVLIPLAAALLVSGPLLTLPLSVAHAQEARPESGAVVPPATTTLHPGDALRIRVWQEPDLSGEFTVDESGVVNLPKLGLVTVTGTPVDRVKAEVTASYGRYITTPVEVTPLLRIQVAGAVRTPGLYRVDPTMSMADALALAGGTTEAGRTDQVRLVRDGKVVMAKIAPDASLATSPLHSGDQLFVPERGRLSRDPGLILGAVSTLATVLWMLRRDR